MTNRKQTNTDNQNSLKEFFDSIRDENEGKITKEKLQAVAKELGYSFTDVELTDMIEVADPKGDGAVTYKGLAKMVHESHQDFPRLKTTIEEIRRELTSLSLSETIDTSHDTDISDNQHNDETSENTTNDNVKESETVNEPTFSTSGFEVDTTGKPDTELNDNLVKNRNKNEDFDADNVVIIRKVMKAKESENRKRKDSKTINRPALVVPVSDAVDDDNNIDIDENQEYVYMNNKTPTDGTIPTVIPLSEKTRTKINKVNTLKQVNEKSNFSNKKLHVLQEEGRRQPLETKIVTESHRSIQSGQSVATRFSLDAGIVSAVDKYNVNKGRTRTRKKSNNHTEEDELKVENEESGDTEEKRETPKDSKTYIRDKTRRIRRKASLTHSQEDIRPQPASKPAVSKRSPSKGRVARVKGQHKSNDKNNLYYSGLGCALKISALRSKQRLLYQMWQLMYDEAMMRLQQTFHYNYARDPPPMSEVKPKPTKRQKKRNSTSSND